MLKSDCLRALPVVGTVLVFIDHGIDEKCAEMRIDIACIGLSQQEHAGVESVVERADARSS